MSDTESRLLARHMGHEFNIHVKHYAKQTQLLEKGKVAKLLVAINSGNLTIPKKLTPIEEIDVRDYQVMDDDIVETPTQLPLTQLPSTVCSNSPQSSMNNESVNDSETGKSVSKMYTLNLKKNDKA